MSSLTSWSFYFAWRSWRVIQLHVLLDAHQILWIDSFSSFLQVGDLLPQPGDLPLKGLQKDTLDFAVQEK